MSNEQGEKGRMELVMRSYPEYRDSLLSKEHATLTYNNFAIFAPSRPLREELGTNCAAGANEGLSLQRLCVRKKE